MDAQSVVAGVLVALCSAWALAMLLPAALRGWLRARLHLPPPAAPAAGRCGGCSGCASRTDARPGPAAPQPVKLVRRPRA